jgi:hypothetical protein
LAEIESSGWYEKLKELMNDEQLRPLLEEAAQMRSEVLSEVAMPILLSKPTKAVTPHKNLSTYNWMSRLLPSPETHEPQETCAESDDDCEKATDNNKNKKNATNGNMCVHTHSTTS